MSIIKHVKIRIGEPLTAVTIEGVAFGSISGYIGYYCFTSQEVTYVKEVFDELIRSITFKNSDIAYACIGDESGLIVNFSDTERIRYEGIQYAKTHNLSQCPNTIPFLYNGVCLLVPFPSTSAKESQVESFHKQSAWIINYETRNQVDLGKIAISAYSVPFSFNGKKLLWLEYLDNKEKALLAFDIQKQTIEKVYNFSPSTKYEFVSHAKWYNDQIVLVKNQKVVQVLDPATNKVVTLYEHISHIIALEIFVKRPNNQNYKTAAMDDKEIDIDFKNEEEKFGDLEAKSGGHLTVVSIDFSEKMYIYEGDKLSRVIELRKLAGFPELLKNNYLFDMGYPYFVAINSKYISFTSDIGMFIINYDTV